MSSKSIQAKRFNKDKKISKTVAGIILFIVRVLWVIPFIYMVGMSFKTGSDVLNNPTHFFPTHGNWTLDNYANFIIRDGHLDNLPKWMINSIIISVLSAINTLFLCLTATYAFCFIRFKGAKAIVSILIASMAVPGVIGMTAQFSIYASIGKALNLTSNPIYLYAWLILPGGASVFNIYLIKNCFNGIPKDIIESARSDGAKYFRIFISIVLPLARSTILLIVLFTFTGCWNALNWPQLLLTGKGEGLQTITLALTGFTNVVGDPWAQKAVSMSTATFSLIPVIILFIFTQNKMIDGLATTGVKN